MGDFFSCILCIPMPDQKQSPIVWTHVMGNNRKTTDPRMSFQMPRAGEDDVFSLIFPVTEKKMNMRMN